MPLTFNPDIAYVYIMYTVQYIFYLAAYRCVHYRIDAGTVTADYCSSNYSDVFDHTKTEKDFPACMKLKIDWN